jgi:hypothetical protein
MLIDTYRHGVEHFRVVSSPYRRCIVNVSYWRGAKARCSDINIMMT